MKPVHSIELGTNKIRNKASGIRNTAAVSVNRAHALPKAHGSEPESPNGRPRDAGCGVSIYIKMDIPEMVTPMKGHRLVLFFCPDHLALLPDDD